MLGAGSHRYLIRALGDDDPRVCQCAMALLAAARSDDQEFRRRLYELISLDAPSSPSEEGLVLGALAAVSELGNVILVGGIDCHLAVSEALKRCIRTWLSFRKLSSTQRGRSLVIQQALCGVLGELGQSRARGVLRQVLREGEPALRGAAQEALHRLDARMNAA